MNVQYLINKVGELAHHYSTQVQRKGVDRKVGNFPLACPKCTNIMCFFFFHTTEGRNKRYRSITKDQLGTDSNSEVVNVLPL